jgi:hypothetical protein
MRLYTFVYDFFIKIISLAPTTQPSEEEHNLIIRINYRGEIFNSCENYYVSRLAILGMIVTLICSFAVESGMRRPTLVHEVYSVAIVK